MDPVLKLWLNGPSPKTPNVWVPAFMVSSNNTTVACAGVLAIEASRAPIARVRVIVIAA